MMAKFSTFIMITIWSSYIESIILKSALVKFMGGIVFLGTKDTALADCTICRYYLPAVNAPPSTNFFVMVIIISRRGPHVLFRLPLFVVFGLKHRVGCRLDQIVSMTMYIMTSENPSSLVESSKVTRLD